MLGKGILTLIQMFSNVCYQCNLSLFIIGLLSECITVEVWNMFCIDFIDELKYLYMYCTSDQIKKNVYMAVHLAQILIVGKKYNSRKYILQK